MRAIVVKEVRESLRWTLLLLLGLAAALAFGVRSDGKNTGVPLVGTLTAIVTAVCFPVAGLTLGLLQVLQDRRRGRWGFVVHRPVSRSRIFAAKVAAGLVLYTIVGGVPLGVAVAWVATPGHVAGPFDWRMALPPLADFLCGLMWYATGLLIGAREARWIGTRLMPIGLTLVVASYAWFMSFHLWQAMLFVAGAVAVILPAAWAAFVAGDDYDRQPVLARGLQAVSLMAGLAITVEIAIGVTASGIEWARLPRGGGAPYQMYWVDRDGRVLRTAYDGHGGGTETDLDGRPVHRGRVATGPEAMATGTVMLNGFPTAQKSWQRRWASTAMHAQEAYVHRLGGVGDARWFYVVARRTVEGFDVTTGRSIGSIGPRGFVPPSQPPQPFAQQLWSGLDSGSSTLLLAGPSVVYHVDPGRRELQTVWTATAGDPIVDFPTTFADANDPASPPFIAVFTRSGIHLLHDAKPTVTLPLEPVDSPTWMLSIGRATDGRYVLRYQRESAVNSRFPQVVVVADAHGRVLSRKELPPLFVDPSGEPVSADVAAVVALPPVLLPVISHGADPALPLWMMMAIIGGGVVSAVLAVPLGRRYVLGRRAIAGWSAFALLTGVGGLLALPALRPLRRRVACPNCGRRRVVTRETCEHCAAPFAEPAAEGIEVFEMA